MPRESSIGHRGTTPIWGMRQTNSASPVKRKLPVRASLQFTNLRAPLFSLRTYHSGAAFHPAGGKSRAPTAAEQSDRDHDQAERACAHQSHGDGVAHVEHLIGTIGAAEDRVMRFDEGNRLEHHRPYDAGDDDPRQLPRQPYRAESEAHNEKSGKDAILLDEGH